MTNRACLLTFLLGLFFAPLVWSQSASRVFTEARAARAAGNRDVAFLLYRQILREYPDSEYAEESQFRVGEYYYQSRNYFNASKSFQAYLKRYPGSRFSDPAREYLAKMELGSLKQRADGLFEEGNLGAASALYQQYLKTDPDNLEVKARLEQIKRSQQEVHLDFEQLHRERRKLEQEKVAVERRVAEYEREKKRVEALHKQALELNKVTTDRYEQRLAAVATEMNGLRNEMAELEKEIKRWRHRAIMVEATRLSPPPRKESNPEPGEDILPRVAFDGVKADPSPEEGEEEVSDIVEEGFPAVVITEATADRKKKLCHVRGVVSVDLSSDWPEGAKMKFRVDFIGKKGQPAPDPPFVVRYYEASDMDEVDEATKSYRKRVLFTADESRVENYEVSAFLVKSK